MKKLFFIASITLVVGLTSCKKDYTCTCVVLGQTLVLPIQNSTKSDAQSSCDAAEATYAASGVASCTLN